MNTFTIPAIPREFRWKNQPLDWRVLSDTSILIVAGEKTDLFIDPAGSFSRDNAPAALLTPPGDHFTLSARVKVDFASAFDAGLLLLYEREDLWAKLCFEYSPEQKPMIVSVVTNGRSDDCNSVMPDGQEIYLRVAITPDVIAFHYSLDSRFWNLVRYCTLGTLHNLQVGFSSQSPTGKKCSVLFSEIRYRADILTDYRNGE